MCQTLVGHFNILLNLGIFNNNSYVYDENRVWAEIVSRVCHRICTKINLQFYGRFKIQSIKKLILPYTLNAFYSVLVKKTYEIRKIRWSKFSRIKRIKNEKGGYKFIVYKKMILREDYLGIMLGDCQAK